MLMKRNKNIRKQELRLTAPAIVFVDWANVYGWQKSIKKDINPQEIFSYFSNLPETKDINLYFGTDKNQKSKDFLQRTREIGYQVFTKEVKYIKNDNAANPQRKCDFDLEIALDCLEKLDKYKTFIFMSGDGDFATLYERLIGKGKKVIVIYEQGHLGKEVWEIKKGVFKTRLTYLIDL